MCKGDQHGWGLILSSEHYLTEFSAVVGEIDEEADSRVDYEHLKAPPLPTVAH